MVVLAAVSDGFALDCGGFKSCKVLSWLGLKKKENSIGITSDLLHKTAGSTYLRSLQLAEWHSFCAPATSWLLCHYTCRGVTERELRQEEVASLGAWVWQAGRARKH